MKFLKISLFILAFSMSSGAGAFAESINRMNTLLPESGGKLLFVSYAGLSGGSSFIPGAVLPSASMSGGLRLSSWFSFGMFVEGVPLSDFEHASLGISAADRENSYMVSSGTELIFTPWSAAVLHPQFKVKLGGTSAGYLVDTDGKEGFEEAQDQRYFLAGASAGMELNLSRCWLLSAHIGGRFVGNGGTMGIDAGALSGMEASIGLRFMYGIHIE